MSVGGHKNNLLADAKIRGSYTVEAVFIVPIVLGLVFAMIYVLFFLHDKAVLYGNMRNAVVESAEGRVKYKNDEEWQDDMQNNLWFFKVTSGKIRKNKLYIKSSVGAEAELDIPIIGYFLNKVQKIKLEDSCLTVHPEYMIRVKGIFKADGADG